MKKERVEKDREHLNREKEKTVEKGDRGERENKSDLKRNTIVLQCHPTFRMAL